MKSIIFSIFLAFVFSCKSKQGDQDNSMIYATSFTGYNLAGEAEICFPEPQNCQSREQKMQEFASDCKNRGHKAFLCSCKLTLCSFNIKRATPY